jgi:hypothetical protein
MCARFCCARTSGFRQFVDSSIDREGLVDREEHCNAALDEVQFGQQIHSHLENKFEETFVKEKINARARPAED